MRIAIGVFIGIIGGGIFGFFGFAIPVAIGIVAQALKTAGDGPGPAGSASAHLITQKGRVDFVQSEWLRAAQGAQWGSWQATRRGSVFVPKFQIVAAVHRPDGDLVLTLEPTRDGLYEADLESHMPIALAALHIRRVEGEVHRHHEHGERYTVHLTNRDRPLDQVKLKGEDDEWVIG